MLYFIYELVDDLVTDIPFYVGMTDNPNERYLAHLTGDGGRNQTKNERITQIVTEGRDVHMKIREIVYEGKSVALERERHWIQTRLNQGIQLTNVLHVKKSRSVKTFAVDPTEQQCFTAKEVYTLEETMCILSMTEAEIRAIARTKRTDEGRIRSPYIPLYKAHVYVKADVDAMTLHLMPICSIWPDQEHQK